MFVDEVPSPGGFEYKCRLIVIKVYNIYICGNVKNCSKTRKKEATITSINVCQIVELGQLYITLVRRIFSKH